MIRIIGDGNNSFLIEIAPSNTGNQINYFHQYESFCLPNLMLHGFIVRTKLLDKRKNKIKDKNEKAMIKGKIIVMIREMSKQ